MEKESIENAPLGVLNEEQMLQLKGKIVLNLNAKSIDGSAFDLHLSNEAWEIDTTAKLAEGETVKDLLKNYNARPKDLSKPLDKKKVCIIKLKESLDFRMFENSTGLYGRASGKSSIGRLDILTRLLVDYSPKYDEVPPAHKGDLYLEVIPISFPIKLCEGFSMHQLRLFKGDPELSVIPSQELNNSSPMLYKNENPVEPRNGILRVNLEPDKSSDDNICAFIAKDLDKELDLTLPFNDAKYKYDPKEYWESIHIEKKNLGLLMQMDRFYILRSVERLFLPNNVAVACVAYTENLGELRIHYAGFAHPNFGRRRKDKLLGAPLIFEARCHNFQVRIRDKEQFAKIEFYRMSKPSKRTSPYSDQELKLSNYFSKWENK
ncbi:MAG: 2'-deoxycytidine 5'-triphosphate deaminase [Bacteroidota bacterium]|jgi:dCTP deaminase